MYLKIRVAIYEDNRDLLDSMTMLIHGSAGFEVGGGFTSAVKIVSDIHEIRPDVILMDIGMPQLSGIEATRLVKKSFPDIPVLIQTVFEDDHLVFEALCAGASGYLLKNTAPAAVLHALKEVYEGGAPLSPAIARKVIASFHLQVEEAGNDSWLPLTQREEEVLNLLVRGRSYKMMAAELGLSFGTIHSHMKNIYKKLHVNSMSEAVAKAIRNRII